MLQHLVVKWVEQIYRLRLLYGLHLALYGALLVVCALTAANGWQSAALPLMIWLPIILLHTAMQSLVELRERRVVYAPIPVQTFNYRAMPVVIYDEDGNPTSSKTNMGLLPRPRG